MANHAHLRPLPGTALVPTVRGRVNETIATLREVVLMPRDLGAVLPRTESVADDIVVLVHGIFASAGVFRPMKRLIVAQTRAEVASFSHAPGAGVDRIARGLARLVERLPYGRRIHLVGHSLGGVVARWYVQELGGHARIAQTISLGSPFGGTTRAHPFPILVGRDLGRTSPVLRRLRARAHEHDVPHTSLVAGDDAVIVPSESAAFPRGDVFVLPGRGHNSLLFDPESIATVTDRVKQVQRKHAQLRAAKR